MAENKMRLLFSDLKGKIFGHPSLGPCGMEGGNFFKLDPDELIKLPPLAQLFTLPERTAVGYDYRTKDFVTLNGAFAVAAFLPPAFTVTHSSAYRETGRPKILPLFSYAAVVSYKNIFYAAAVKIDKDKRHDQRFIDLAMVKKGAVKLKKALPKNRLIPHLENCALSTRCPNAQNFFLSRYECPLPTSPSCNARCAGCISYQPDSGCKPSQQRIKFVPTPEEVSEIALFHIANVRDPIVSFGQGCEGEPLIVADVIERSIQLIRNNTKKGVINMNTNASRPDELRRLFDAGLNSIRVSLNSARPIYYEKYYRPSGYNFSDVMRSIGIAKDKKAFVSINYLIMPGFTDTKEEFEALKKMIKKYGIDMIQWRNLNFDPIRYFSQLKILIDRKEIIGVGEVINSLKRTFPELKTGYFNPRVIVSPHRPHPGL